VPQFDHRAMFEATAEAVFALLQDVSCRPEFSSPSMHLEVAEGPGVASVGSRHVWKIRRFGVSQRIVTQFEVVESPQRLVESQVEGPFPLWRHETTLTHNAGSTTVSDVVNFAPPKGMLGFIVTEARILADLEAAFRHRDEGWRRILA